MGNSIKNDQKRSKNDEKMVENGRK